MTARSVDSILREAGDNMQRALHALADDLADRPVEYLTARQVADILHLDVQTIHRKARAGELPYKRLGKKYLFPADAVRELG